MRLLHRILLLCAISIGGLALLAPLAARSATQLPVEIAVDLLRAAEAPRFVADRGGLVGRQALMVASRTQQQTPEKIDSYALPTPAAAPMAATLYRVPAPSPRRAVTYVGESVWDDLARCESGGNWAIDTGNGYYGGLQFSLGTWQGYGGTEFASYPHEATREQQILVAERLRAARGYAPWPACRAKLGLP